VLLLLLLLFLPTLDGDLLFVCTMQAAGLGSPDCNFCESGALTYSTFAECYAAEAAFIPQVCPAGQPR
jgi:hypothetical protein